MGEEESLMNNKTIVTKQPIFCSVTTLLKHFLPLRYIASPSVAVTKACEENTMRKKKYSIFILSKQLVVLMSFPIVVQIPTVYIFFFSAWLYVLALDLLLDNDSERIECVLRFVIKYGHVYSAGPCCHISLHIYKDTIYKRCYS